MIIDTEAKRIELNDHSELEAVGRIKTEYSMDEVVVLYGALKFAQVYTSAVEEKLKRERESGREAGEVMLFGDEDMRTWKHQGYLNNMLSTIAEHVPPADRKAVEAFYDGPPAAPPRVPRPASRLHQKIAGLVRQA